MNELVAVTGAVAVADAVMSFAVMSFAVMTIAVMNPSGHGSRITNHEQRITNNESRSLRAGRNTLCLNRASPLLDFGVQVRAKLRRCAARGIRSIGRHAFRDIG